MSVKRFLLVAALMGFCAPASAAAPQEEGGWYGGLNVRGEHRLGMGYRFGPRFSVEGTYGGLDSQRYEAPAAPWAQKIEPWPSYGMSARYEFSKRLFGRFEWDRYSPASELDAFRRGDERYQFRFGFRF
jgi:hypothetical protein